MVNFGNFGDFGIFGNFGNFGNFCNFGNLGRLIWSEELPLRSGLKIAGCLFVASDAVLFQGKVSDGIGKVLYALGKMSDDLGYV